MPTTEKYGYDRKKTDQAQKETPAEGETASYIPSDVHHRYNRGLHGSFCRIHRRPHRFKRPLADLLRHDGLHHVGIAASANEVILANKASIFGRTRLSSFNSVKMFS